MSRHIRLPSEAFVWPCEKRIAHGPHETCCCDEHGDPTWECNVHDLCPGVTAHPKTMIGRGALPVHSAFARLFPEMTEPEQ